jgi:hypothetical protein
MIKFAMTVILFSFSLSLHSGTCECLCWQEPGSCGHPGPDYTLDESCFFPSPSAAACESSSCNMSQRQKVRGCSYTR